MFKSRQKKGFTPLEISKSRLLTGQDTNKSPHLMPAAGFYTQPLLVQGVDPTAASCGVFERCGDKRSKFLTGFTLIELLVAIAIIGILATIVLTIMNNTRKKARDAVRWSDMDQISKAMLLYYDAANPNSYPNISNAQQSITVARWNSSGLNKYIVNAPLDPGGSTYYWRDRNTPLTCFCVYVKIESEVSRWILANPSGVKKVNSNPNSGNCSTQ